MARYTRNEASTVPQINTELEKIEAAIEDSLSRKGDAPNSMSGPLDMNNQRILNIPEPVDSTDPLRKIDGEQYVTAAAASAAEALESEQNAAASATSAAASASSASSDASVAAGLIEDLNAIYLGAFITGPETDNEGNPLQQGALYYNTVTKNLMVFNGTSWVISVSQELADAAAASAAQAEDSAAAALASEQAADTSEQLAEQHKDSALASASSASSSASAASASQSAAATSATNAATSASQASSSASAASASASAAAVSETNASNSESAAATSESNAASSASAALSSEAAASSSATIAAGSATTAVAASAAAEGHSDDALASANAAGVSATNASDSATSAASSASAASASASAASDSEDAALASEQAAALSESNAATSASQSASSATAASASASAAATSEANASASETNAANSATSAASSASAAAGSATSASNSAATALLYLNDTEAARDEVLQYSTAVSKGLVFVGVYDASTGVYPSLPVDVIGNPFWIIETGGTISGTVYQAGDSLIRDVENSQWIKLDTVDQVSSVAGKVGAVVLDKADVGLSNVDNTSDLNKPISTATQSALNNKSNVGHTHVIADVSNLQSSLDGKAAVSHTHIIGDVTGLQTALDGKAAVSHTHSIANVTGLQGALDGKAPLTGAGTSGTWPINVTGNAGTATTANNATNLGGLSSTYYDHRAYTSASNYLGGHYTSGGTEKPNSSTFGAGKLKLAMLGSGNLGFGGAWNDVLWLSGYTGGDVKGSYAIVCDKYNDEIWFSRQNFDSASWGTGRRLLHSGNYNSYSPTLTGGGASGTWGINITGNAGSVTNGVYTTGNQTIGGVKTFSSGINLANTDIGNINSLSFNDPGVNEGISWLSGNGWQIYESPDNMTNASGNLQFTTGTTFRYRVDTSGNTFSQTSSRAPIFYDSNNTAYYVDPTSTSYLDAIGRRAHHRGHLVGSYNNIGDNSGKSNPIYTIGSAYNPTESSLSNMYGVGYSHSNFFGTSLTGGSWGFYVAADGNARVVLNGSNGNIGCTGNVTAYASDERLKTNISVIKDPLNKLKKISGVTYDWIDECEDLGFIPTHKHEHGVIAQHIQGVIPDAVKTAPFNDIATERTGEDRNYLTVDKEKIIPLLIEAIKEQQTQIEALTSEINTLKEMIK